MSSSDVISALQTRLDAIASPLPTQWENSVYEPVAGVPYQQVFFNFAKPVNPEMSSMFQDNGYMQVTLRYPIDGGASLALARAEALRDWFARGLSFVANAHSVQISATASMDRAFVNANRYCIPVKIYFTA